jgi:hypothetical protein
MILKLFPYILCFSSDFVPTGGCKSLQTEQTTEEVAGQVSRRARRYIVKEFSFKGKGT